MSGCLDFFIADDALLFQPPSHNPTNSPSTAPELPAVGILCEMDPSHLAFLASYGKFVRPTDGDTIIEQGKGQDSRYIVLSGLVHVTATAGDRTLLVKAYGSGDAFGEVNLFDPGSASASVIAKSDCVIWRISAAELGSFLEADPVAGVQLTHALLRSLSKHLRAMNAKLAESEEKAALHSFWKSDS
jgi:CRP/FNR family cyclic AMP-dependent transcriptional regulator